MAKRGKAYEKVVAEIVKALDPGAAVHQGRWVIGPDGRRELDVYIGGTVDGRPRTALIECKDFHPDKSGPVGIGYVDALESKRRDVGVDVSFICSNAGFTAEAISKAKRVGIGLLAVMKQGDKRIRVSVVEELYIRKVQLKGATIALRSEKGPIPLDGVRFEEVLFQGTPVGNWVIHRIQVILGRNPIVKGRYRAAHALKAPTEFTIPHTTVIASHLDFEFTITGGWFAQQVTIDSTGAVYDWLRRRIRLLPGPGKIHFKGLNFDAGTAVERPPESELELRGDLRDGEFEFAFVSVEGLEQRQPVPDIDGLMEPVELEVDMPDVTPEAYTSADA